MQNLFEAAGIQSVLATVDGSRTLTGYYACAHPPQLDFGFPSISNATAARSDPRSPVSRSSTIFNVLQLAENSTDGNCTAVIHGTDEFGSGPGAVWLVGQGEWDAWLYVILADESIAFFQGKYIDHNVDDFTMGFANLLDY